MNKIPNLKWDGVNVMFKIMLNESKGWYVAYYDKEDNVWNPASCMYFVTISECKEYLDNAKTKG
jgi:hypothetical protein